MTEHPRLVARRRRFTRIRKTVAGAAIALFIALFSTIYVQMAAGHDPALKASSAQSAVVSPAVTDDAAATSTATDTTSTDTTASDPAPVITQQS